MKTSSVKTEVWRLILLPAISITLLLSATLTFLYITKLDSFVDQRGRTLAEKTAHLAHIAMRSDSPELLQQLIKSTLEEPLVRAVHVFDEINNENHHTGPRFQPTLADAGPVNGAARVARTEHSTRFAYPIVNGQGEKPLGWLEIELVLSPYWVTVYQMLLIVVLATTACLLLAGYLAVKLHANITDPLHLIGTVIDQLSKGQLESRVKGQFAYEFEKLAEAVNTMADSQEQAQHDMQLHIDQSMEDLRETLETIEVQNIELDMARKEALAASQIKSEFLANTSHEIRTPLNGIIGFTNLALKTPLEDKQRGYLQTIHDSAQNLLTIINDILDFSKIESGKLVLDYVPLPLRQVVESAVDTLAFEALEKNLQIVTVIDNSIPPQLMGDPLRFTQIISNLLGNAIKFSQRGTISIDITLEHFEENQITIKVAVTDEGIGLTQEQQAQLFSAFAQADASISREYGGTGLGLAICKGLVDRMHGSVGVRSEPEKGATFWFTAKLGVDPNYAAPEQNCLRGKRVLICSDSELGYRQLESLADCWQALTLWINSIHDIFPTLRKEQAAGFPYHLMILDVSPDERKLPPALLGNLAEQLELEFSCKVIVCCMPAHRQMFEQHTNSRTIAFVQKPITYEHLLDAISDSLGVDLSTGEQPEPLASSIPERHVLLVDDNEANLQLTTEFLRDLNVEVTQAHSGDEAIALFQQNRFDIVFMDIQMPGMDGMETTGHLRQLEIEEGKRTPIVALTAHSMTEHKTDLLIAGMDDCIRKPVTEEQLAHMLDRWTKRKDTPQDAIVYAPQAPAEPTPSQRVHASSGPVNISQCLALANQKVDRARDMLVMLIDSLPAEQKRINGLAADQNWSELREPIHKLYGSSCYCGVPYLRALAGLLDKALQADQTESVVPILESLNRAIDELFAWAERADIDQAFAEAVQSAPENV